MVRAITAVALALTLAPSAPAAQAGQQAGEGSSRTAPRPNEKGAAPAAQVPQAPPATSAAKASPAAEGVARAITTQPSWNDTIRAYASSLSSQIEAAMKSQGGEAPKDVEQRVRTGLDKAVGYDEVVRLQAQALAGRFSEDELRTLQKFYESPAGKKLVTELPAVSRQVIDVVQQRISSAIPRIVQDVAPSLARSQPGSADQGSASGTAAPKDPKDAQGRKPPAQTPPRH